MKYIEGIIRDFYSDHLGADSLEAVLNAGYEVKLDRAFDMAQEVLENYLLEKNLDGELDSDIDSIVNDFIDKLCMDPEEYQEDMGDLYELFIQKFDSQVESIITEAKEKIQEVVPVHNGAEFEY